jgi:hypothetical protein
MASAPPLAGEAANAVAKPPASASRIAFWRDELRRGRDSLSPIGRCTEMAGIASYHHSQAGTTRQAHRVIAANCGNRLPHAILAVVQKARAAFRNHTAVGVRIHIAALQLFQIIDQQLDAVRIHTAQIGSNQRFRRERGFGRRQPGCFQKLHAKFLQVFVADQTLGCGHGNLPAYRRHSANPARRECYNSISPPPRSFFPWKIKSASAH